MKKLYFSFIAFSLFMFGAFAQISEGGRPISFVESAHQNLNLVEPIVLAKPNIPMLLEQDQINDALGRAYRVGTVIQVNLSPMNSGTWTTLADGSKVWQLQIKSRDALALGIYFSEEVVLPAGSKLFAFNNNKNQVVGAFTSNTPRFQAMQMVEGEVLTLEYYAPAHVVTYPTININEVTYFYRGVEDFVNDYRKTPTMKAQACQVDVACTPERNGWEDQIRSVVHYTFTINGSTFVCSAATINNTAQDCKPYILTAWHCGERSAGTSIASWVWYWNYQKTSCAPNNNNQNPSKGTQTMTGGQVRASSGNGTLNNPPGNNQVAGSDFYLVELNSAIPSAYNPYFAGWDRNTAGATSGVGIHHPAGSAKKISTFTSTLTNTSFNGGGNGHFWRVVWSATTNGHGVTEGGSSGSPIFNQNKLLVGQLTGGSSACNATTQPDVYGQFRSDWDLNGTANTAQLKPWIDPISSNVLTLAGTNMPCSPQPPVAEFVANQTNVLPATTVSFTDQSSNSPTSWSWSVSPGTGWAYAGGTNASSQNPQITFNTVGQYTVALTATNTLGSNTNTKTNYIVVSETVSYCAASATNSPACEEYISNVSIGTINNTTNCTSYSNFTAQSATVTKGQQYTVTVNPRIIGNNEPTIAFTNDEIAVWIDYNNDGVFANPGERVGYVLVGQGWSSQFTFTVPTTAVTGAVRMRCRISYQPEDGNISPCGTSNWGETEDYTINIVAPSGSGVGIENETAAALSIYPNPSTGEFYIDATSLGIDHFSFQVFDIQGSILRDGQFQADDIKLLDLSQLAKGVYNIRLISGDFVVVKRIVIQ